MNKITFLLPLLAVLALSACTTANPTGKVTGTDTAESGQVVMLGLDRSGYTPNPIVVEAGKPVTLKRDDSLLGCAVFVVQRDLGINANFGQSETYTFTPTEKGTYDFSCSMGMFHGVIQVT